MNMHMNIRVFTYWVKTSQTSSLKRERGSVWSLSIWARDPKRGALACDGRAACPRVCRAACLADSRTVCPTRAVRESGIHQAARAMRAAIPHQLRLSRTLCTSSGRRVSPDALAPRRKWQMALLKGSQLQTQEQPMQWRTLQLPLFWDLREGTPQLSHRLFRANKWPPEFVVDTRIKSNKSIGNGIINKRIILYSGSKLPLGQAGQLPSLHYH